MSLRLQRYPRSQKRCTESPKPLIFMQKKCLTALPHAAQPPQSLPPSGGGNWEIKFLQPRSYGDARQPDSLSDPRNSTPPDRSGFGAGPETACPLVEHGLKAGVFRFDDL